MTQVEQPIEMDEILTIALNKELNSFKFYSDLLIKAQTESVRELLEQLKDDEFGHIHRIESMLAKLRMGKAITA